jgi:hypothetical protein
MAADASDFGLDAPHNDRRNIDIMHLTRKLIGNVRKYFVKSTYTGLGSQ